MSTLHPKSPSCKQGQSSTPHNTVKPQSAARDSGTHLPVILEGSGKPEGPALSSWLCQERCRAVRLLRALLIVAAVVVGCMRTSTTQ